MRTCTNIRKREDGLYEGRYFDGTYKRNGAKHYSSVYARNYQECKEKLENAKKLLNVPMEKRKITFGEVFDSYLGHFKKTSTITTYLSLYKCHLERPLSGKRITAINHEDLNSILLRALEEHSEAQAENIKRLLVALMNFSLATKLIPEKITGIIPIKVPKSKIEVFSDIEQENLEDYCLNSLNYITFGILLSLYTGIRIGELCAAKIYDVNTNESTLLINKTMIRVKNLEKNANTKTKVIIETPKSESAIREVPLPKFLVDIFISLYINCNKNCYLLTGSLSRFIEPRNLENQYKKILKNCSIKYRKFHTLRHTFATNALSRNYYDLKTLSEILGHSDPSMTLKKYVHSTKRIKELQVKNIDRDFISRKNYGIRLENVS